MAKLIITVEGGKVTQTLNFLDRNIKDNRYVYGNGNESGIMDDPEKIYADIPDCQRLTADYSELLESVNLGKVQITDIMRRFNELEKEMDAYAIPTDEHEQEHVIMLNNNDLKKLLGDVDLESMSDKHIESAVKKLIQEQM